MTNNTLKRAAALMRSDAKSMREMHATGGDDQAKWLVDKQFNERMALATKLHRMAQSDQVATPAHADIACAVWDVFSGNDWFMAVTSPLGWDAAAVSQSLTAQRYAPWLHVMARHRGCDGNPVVGLIVELERMRNAVSEPINKQLLAALKSIVDCCESLDFDGEPSAASLLKAKSAIAAAESPNQPDPVNQQMLAALKNAVRLLRAAGYTMEGAPTTAMLVAIAAAEDAQRQSAKPVANT